MAQRVNYEPIPGTRYDQYMFKLRMVLGFLSQPGGTKFKAFRDFVRKQNLWDKDKSEVIFSLVEITWDKKDVKVGKTAKKLAAAHSDAEFQQIIFDRLREQNILLVKYVMEALDVTQGGRLHSVHELYRMITSYVYPGAYITLTAFQAWIDWMAASGFIKLVGIRWALSERGQKVVNELRSMDVDEILEDMADDGEEEDGDDDAGGDDAEDEDDDTPAPAPLKVAAPAPPPAAKPKPAAPPKESADFDDDEDLFADLPPEPEAPDEEAIAAASKRLGLDDEDDDEAEAPPRPAAPKYTPPASLAPKPRGDAAQPKKAAPDARPQRMPSATVAGLTPAMSASPAGTVSVPTVGASYLVVPASAIPTADRDALVERVTGFWSELSDWPTYTADRLGVVQDPGAGDLKLLIELGVIACLIEGLPPQPQVFAFVKRMRETTFFASLGHGEGLEEGLDALERAAQDPWARPLFERLVHARFIARRVGMKIDLLYQLKSAATGRECIELLREHMTGPHFIEAPFWVLRELVRLGAVTSAAAKAALAVPHKAMREAAATIGLTQTTALKDFESLMALSEAVSALFGTKDLGYGESLAALPRGLGLFTR